MRMREDWQKAELKMLDMVQKKLYQDTLIVSFRSKDLFRWQKSFNINVSQIRL